jgi:hypothetical protein
MRRWQIVTAVVMLVCVVALLIPHSESAGCWLACVLFFPVFLFGLLDPRQWLGTTEPADVTPLPQAPCLNLLFQRPPPAFESIRLRRPSFR